MSENQFEKSLLPNRNDSFEQNKIRTLRQICLKICDYFDIYETDYMHLMEDTEFGFSEKEYDAIDYIISRLPEIIHDEITKNPDTVFVEDSDIAHIIGNSPLAQQRLVELRVKKKIAKFQNNTRPIIPENDKGLEKANLPGLRNRENPNEKSAYINYWIDKLDMSSEEKQVFLNFRQSRALLLYYLNLIEEPDNRNVLLAEMASADGWLEELKHYYKEEARLPSESDSRLQHINFFARLKGLKSSLSKKISAFTGITTPITQENFQKEFEGLKDKDFLNKELIYEEFFPEASRMAA